MIRATVENGTVLLQQFEQLPIAMRAQLAAGMRQATEVLKRDVVAHTPRRSGRARQAVMGYFRKDAAGTEQSATVQYDYKQDEAWYMRFFLTGTRPHWIHPKGHRTSKRAMLRRAERGRQVMNAKFYGGESWASTWVRESVNRVIAGGHLPSQVGPVLPDAFGALAIPWVFAGAGKGTFFAAKAMHPGIVPARLLTRRLEARAGDITKILEESVERALAPENMFNAQVRNGDPAVKPAGAPRGSLGTWSVYAKGGRP